MSELTTPKIDRAIAALAEAEAAMRDLPGLAAPRPCILGGYIDLTPETVAREVERLEKLKAHLLATVKEGV